MLCLKAQGKTKGGGGNNGSGRILTSRTINANSRKGHLPLIARQAHVGATGPTTFSQTGGTHTTQTLVLNAPGHRYAAYHVAAGTVDATAAVDQDAPSADGPGVVDEGSPYTLGLFGDSTITRWQVGWGDGATDTLAGDPPSATHAYAAGGNTYAVTPTAYDGTTAHPAGTVPVLVNDLPAAVLIGGQASTAAAPATLANPVGQATTLSATFTDAGTTETHTALVDWGDGTTSAAAVTEADGSGTITAAHAYARHGTYAATLLLTDSGGAVATVPFAVTVAYVAPAVSATADAAAVTPGEPATLTLHDGGPEAPSAVTGWSVDWGDGTAPQAVTTPPDATDPNDATWTVTHAYAAAGSYAVTATATDSAGGHAAAPVAVAVAAAAPTGLTATAVSPDEIDLGWAGGGTAASWFDIFGSIDGVHFEYLDSVTGDQRAYRFQNLIPNTTITFEVVNAAAPADQSLPSNTATATTEVDPWNLQVAGAATAAEGGPYALSLAAAPLAGAPPLDHWTVDWGDGSTPDAYPAGTGHGHARVRRRHRRGGRRRVGGHGRRDDPRGHGRPDRGRPAANGSHQPQRDGLLPDRG